MSQPEINTTRIEAFSDGVIAIIITIIVLEIHVPKGPTFAALFKLWPTLLAYALSFAYIAIYWVNHHYLLHRARRFSVGLHWPNVLLLFFLSLVPLSTAWLDAFPLARVPTATYLVTLMMPAAAYMWLAHEVYELAGPDTASPEHVRVERVKQLLSVLIYATGVGLAFYHPTLSLGCALMVSVMWFIPDGPFDRLLTRRVNERHSRWHV